MSPSEELPALQVVMVDEVDKNYVVHKVNKMDKVGKVYKVDIVHWTVS